MVDYNTKSGEYCSDNHCSYKNKEEVPGKPPGCCLRGCCEFGRKFLGWET